MPHEGLPDVRQGGHQRGQRLSASGRKLRQSGIRPILIKVNQIENKAELPHRVYACHFRIVVHFLIACLILVWLTNTKHFQKAPQCRK